MISIGCVPYLNAKPLIDWFHSPDCNSDAQIIYSAPSELACGLRDGSLDVALVSTFELFRNPALVVIPHMSVAADGPVRSVRLFSRVPFNQIESVALDTSSLTSVALIQVLLREVYGITPRYEPHAPNLEGMLATCDAGLLIGDLQLFDTPAHYVMDLGEAWKELTGLPFVYAAWLARAGRGNQEVGAMLLLAKEWGIQRLGALTEKWSREMKLPRPRVHEYFHEIMQYDLNEMHWRGLRTFQKRCEEHGLITRGIGIEILNG